MKKSLFFILSTVFSLMFQNIWAQDSTLPDTITVTAVGDIMLGSIVPDMSYCPPNNDASHLLDEVKLKLRFEVQFPYAT